MVKQAKRHNTVFCSFCPPTHTLSKASSLEVLGRGKRQPSSAQPYCHLHHKTFWANCKLRASVKSRTFARDNRTYNPKLLNWSFVPCISVSSQPHFKCSENCTSVIFQRRWCKYCEPEEWYQKPRWRLWHNSTKMGSSDTPQPVLKCVATKFIQETSRPDFPFDEKINCRILFYSVSQIGWHMPIVSCWTAFHLLLNDLPSLVLIMKTWKQEWQKFWANNKVNKRTLTLWWKLLAWSISLTGFCFTEASDTTPSFSVFILKTQSKYFSGICPSLSERKHQAWPQWLIPLNSALARPHLKCCAMFLGSPVQDRHWHTGANPAEGHQDSQRAGPYDGQLRDGFV